MDIQKKIISIIKGNKKFISYLFIVAILLFAAYSFYTLFNPTSDYDYEKKIQDGNESVKIKFDEQTINEIINPSKANNDSSKTTRSPFLSY